MCVRSLAGSRFNLNPRGKYLSTAIPFHTSDSKVGFFERRTVFHHNKAVCCNLDIARLGSLLDLARSFHEFAYRSRTIYELPRLGLLYWNSPARRIKELQD